LHKGSYRSSRTSENQLKRSKDVSTNSPGTFEVVALELSRALESLAGRLHEPHHALILFAELGIKLPVDSLSPALTNAIEGTHEVAHALPTITQDLVIAIDGGNANEIIAKGIPVAQQVATLISSFETIAAEVNNLGSVPGIDPTDLIDFVSILPKRLFETIVVEYFEGYHQIPLTLLEFFGIVEKTRQNIGSTDPGNPEIVKKELRLDRIGALLQSPDRLLESLYGWGQLSFNGELLIQRISNFLRATGIPVTYWQMSEIPLRPVIEVSILTIAPTVGLIPPGIEAILTDDVSDGTIVDIPFTKGWIAHLAASGALNASVGLRVQPPANISVIPPSGSVQGQLTAGIASVPVSPAKNIVILGLAGGTSFTAEWLLVKPLEILDLKGRSKVESCGSVWTEQMDFSEKSFQSFRSSPTSISVLVGLLTKEFISLVVVLSQSEFLLIFPLEQLNSLP
jgi:hypothetical protein